MDNKNSINELNKLIEINNDRMEGYETALKETDETDLMNLFSHFKETSSNCNAELIHEVNILGGIPNEGTKATGKIYRVWMDFKALLTGKDRKSILNSCEYGEIVAIELYQDIILDNDNFLSVEHKNMLKAQLALIEKDHNKIEKLINLLVESD
jgi:uncharacterized protein (TIGR02284 family)